MTEEKRITNAEFARGDKAFREHCSNAGIEPSRRQASKYRNKEGAAYRSEHFIKEVR